MSRQKQNVIVISLPASNGGDIKETLQHIADKEDRSLSNMCVKIFKKYILEQDTYLDSEE